MKRWLPFVFAPSVLVLVLVAGCNQGPSKPNQADADGPDGTQVPKLEKLVVEETAVGTGQALEKGDVAYVLYAGMLVNGTEFDSNITGKFPLDVTIGMGEVIKGWDEGLLGLKVGGKRTLKIPSAMGYGERGNGEKIPPNSDLVFDVELVDVVKKGEDDIVDWKVLKQGSGRAAKEGDTVTIDYQGLSPTDAKFEEWSNQKFKLGIDGTIGLPGLDFGITGMKVGERRKIRVPAKVGYGMGGRMDLGVPKNMVVYFDVTLKGIQ